MLLPDQLKALSQRVEQQELSKAEFQSEQASPQRSTRTVRSTSCRTSCRRSHACGRLALPGCGKTTGSGGTRSFANRKRNHAWIVR